jgi:hypothetical protein
MERIFLPDHSDFICFSAGTLLQLVGLSGKYPQGGGDRVEGKHEKRRKIPGRNAGKTSPGSGNLAIRQQSIPRLISGTDDKMVRVAAVEGQGFKGLWIPFAAAL